MNNDLVQQIHAKISIVSEIQKHVTLKKKGNNYFGLCPFHKEKTPSFLVNNVRSNYYCFGCGEGGDVISFISKIKNISFLDTISYLAEIYNINYTRQPASKAQQISRNKQQQLYQVQELAKQFFHQNLLDSNNKHALNYLLKRGLNMASIKKFQLGFSTSNRNHLKEKFGDTISNELLLEAGLLAVSDNNSIYEVFTNRVMFPINNKLNKTIAFGGRIIDDTNSGPKYLNSKESEIFHKKNNLYAFSESLKNIRDGASFILVEGYLDVISLHQNGFTTAVAPLGTAVSKEQLQLIFNASYNSVICLDGDMAGQKASKRVALLLLEILSPNMLPRFVTLTDNQDPDSFIKNHRAEDFSYLLAKAVPLSRFLLMQECKMTLGDTHLTEASPEALSTIFERLKGYAQVISSKFLAGSFINFFKNELGFGYNKDRDLHINQIRRQSSNHIRLTKNNITKSRESLILALIISFPENYDKIDEALGAMTFEEADLEELRQAVIGFLEEEHNTVSSEQLRFALAEKNFTTILNHVYNNELVKTYINGDAVENSQQALQHFRDICDTYRDIINDKEKSYLRSSMIRGELEPDKASERAIALQREIIKQFNKDRQI